MTLIIKKFKEKTNYYLDEILYLITDYIESPYLEYLNRLFFLLFENYEFKMRKYYYRLIPKFLRIIKMDIPERNSYLELLILISKSDYIIPYVKLVLEDIKTLIINTKDLTLLDLLLDLLKTIADKNDVYIYFPLILSTILRKTENSIKKPISRRTSRSDSLVKSVSKNYVNSFINVNVLNKFFEILDIMNNKYRKYFLLFLPKIINYCITNGLIDNSEFRQKLKKYINYETEYTFMTVEKYKKKIFLDYCAINCIYGFNSFSLLNTIDYLHNPIMTSQDLDFEKTMDDYFEERRKGKASFSKRRLTMKIIQSRPSSIKNDIVIKSFENSNCTLEKDWIEWYRKVNKSVLEQNPSKFIYIYYIITEYYFNMTLDLNLHSFLSVFNNNTDNNRGIIIGNLEKALLNPNTPDYIIISILNLIDFSEKKKTIISFMKHEELGKIAYNCKDYAKALYFKEKGFEDDSNLESIDDFIDLYYKLNVTENGKGIIQFIENNDIYQEIKAYDKKYIWYINLHDYNKALQIINEKLFKEIDQKNIKILKNYRNICLYGLCDWETILSEDENEDDENILKINLEENRDSISLIDDKAENEEKLERKLLLLKSCLALGKWDKFFMHMNEIKEIFMRNTEKEYTNSNFDVNLKNKSEKVLSRTFSKSFDGNIDQYISFNDLINKNEFKLLKYDESIFDLIICAIIESLKKNNIDIARKYINSCQKLLINKLKVLIKETNTRGNDALFKNQCLQQLEKYCNYKQYHSGDQQYLEQLKSSFKLLKINLNQNPEMYIQYIAISSLINPIEEEYHRYIDLAKFYIKSDQFTQAENILNILKKKLNIKDNFFDDKNLIFDEKRIKIELCYNKCLFAKGNVDQAVHNLKDLINLLNDNNLSDYNKLRNVIKSKIYGNYAMYKIKQLFQSNPGNRIKRQKSENINGIYSRHISNYLNKHNFVTFLPKKEDSEKVKKVKFNVDETFRKSVKQKDNKSRKNNVFNFDFLNEQENIDSINHYLALATEFNNKSYKYWHNYGVFNYKCYKLLYIYKKAKKEVNKKKMAQVFEFAINSINGLKNSILMANKSKVRTLDDCLRFIDIFFELGNKNKNILSLIESIINEINLEIFIGVIPQLTCRFDIKEEKVLDILINMYLKINLIKINK